MQPIALLGHHHSCPYHVGGPLITGQVNVTVNGIPVACVTDQMECRVSIDTIVEGSTMVTINGLAVARLGDPTAHGGQVADGDPLILVG